MVKTIANAERLLKIGGRLGEAIDPPLRPELVEQITIAAGATGAVLLQNDTRTRDVPRTVGVDEFNTPLI